VARLWVLGMAVTLGGCAPSIGDHCNSSTDCSVQGNRTCDTSQPGGYCTVLGCTANSCPNSAACVVFRVSIPGCAYDDYHAPARTGRALCMAHCDQDSDCRQSDGYVCANPTGPQWRAAILDDKQNKVCIQLGSDAGVTTSVTPCSAASSGSPDAGSPGAAPDASGDVAVDARDAAIDAGADAEASSASEGG
jgi:hypothetical protein